MKSKLFLLVAVFMFTVTGKAQNTETKPFKIGIGLSAGLPVGDYADFASLALSLDVQGEYTIMSNLGVTLSAGYLNFVSKSGYGELGIGQIPILVGGKYYFSDKVYGSLQVGVALLTTEGAGTAFAIAPGIGYKISKKIDVMAKYQSATVDESNISFLGIRAGYIF